MLDEPDWLVAIGAGCCAIGGYFVYCYRCADRFVNILKDVEEVAINEKLCTRVENAGGTLPYVAIKGRVHADDKVIHSINNEEGGVIIRTQTREHKQTWNGRYEQWSHSEKAITSVCKEEPFSLVGEGELHENPETKVHVDKPMSAYKLELTTTDDQFEPSSSGLASTVEALLTGEHVKGYQTIEQMLLVSSTRTVIGELVKKSEGELVIRKPSDNSLLYFITTDELEDVVDKEASEVASWKFRSLLLFIIGGGILMYWAYKRYRDYAEKKNSRDEFQRLQREMEEFDENVDNVRICSICLTRPRDVVFLPCGHVCSCSQCGHGLHNCPVCRQLIQNASAVFFS